MFKVMADEAIITPEQEVKEVQEGTVEEIIAPQEEVKEESPATVPLSTYLELKEDVKSLKQELKNSKGSSQTRVEIQGVEDLSRKYPDVSQEFIQDMLSSATQEATKKIEAKYTPILERQEQEKKQLAFDKAFDNLFEGALQANPDLPKTIDKELVKTLALTPKYQNVPVAEILLKMYGTQVPAGKPSSENDSRSSSDRVEDIVTFDKITPSQKEAIMADPKVRAKYFSWLDTQIG